MGCLIEILLLAATVLVAIAVAKTVIAVRKARKSKPPEGDGEKSNA